MTVVDAWGFQITRVQNVGRCRHYPLCPYETKPHRALRVVLNGVRRHLSRKHSESDAGYVTQGVEMFRGRSVVTRRPLNRWELAARPAPATEGER